MQRRIFSLVFTVLVCAFMPALSRADSLSYTFQTLNNNSDTTFNQLLSINSSGTIAGYFGSGAPNATPPPFTSRPNKGYTLAPPYGQANYTNENFPGSFQTQVTGINNSGTTVGFYADSNGSTTPNFFGFTDVGGTFTKVNDPNTPTTAPTTNQLLGLNNSDVAVGFFTNASGASQAYEYNFSSSTPSFTAINPPNSPTSSTATGINNQGIITGFSTLSDGDTAGFIDDSGTFTTGLEFPGSTNTMFLGVNDNGMFVGVYVDASGNNNGFVYDPSTGTWTTVNDPFAVTGAGNGTTINGINDKGQLVGFYVDANGNTDGLLADPTPEPASLLLLGTGLIALGIIWKRRKHLA